MSDCLVAFWSHSSLHYLRMRSRAPAIALLIASASVAAYPQGAPDMFPEPTPIQNGHPEKLKTVKIKIPDKWIVTRTAQNPGFPRFASQTEVMNIQ